MKDDSPKVMTKDNFMLIKSK